MTDHHPQVPATEARTDEGRTVEAGTVEPVPAVPSSAGAAAPAPRVIEFPFAELRVVAWPDEILDRLGHDPRSPYVERFWVSILGPSATLLLRRLATGLDLAPDGFSFEPEAWARELGVGIRGGKNSPFWRAIERTGRFRATRLQGDTLFARRRLDSLNIRQVDRLPAHLQRAHHAWAARQLAEHQKPRPPVPPLAAVPAGTSEGAA